MIRPRLLGVIVLAVLSSLVAPPETQGQGRRRGRGFGPDADFPKDRAVFHFLLLNHKKIRRTVKLRKDGVETVTESDDPKIAAKIREHVKAMYRRVDKNRPIRRRDPLFAELFRHAGKIRMTFKETKTGIRVVESSKDPHTVRLIQAHANVVSQFVKKGFLEAHKAHAVPSPPNKAKP